MNYEESLAYIKDAEQYGSVLGLFNMQEMMKRLHSPQEKLSVIHVAGTNGKGSVIAYLCSVLRRSGKKVGRYTSPAIYEYRERFELDGEMITEERFARAVTDIAGVISGMTAEGLPHPTPFEIETAAAYLYYYEEKCDILIVEVGMGGDLDATNVISRPLLSVITSLSMDHMAFLGDSLAEIAAKKAGIIKPGCPMVSARQKEEAAAVLREVCVRCGVPYEEADPDSAEILEDTLDGLVFSLPAGGKEPGAAEREIYRVRLTGDCQRDNAVLALKALEVLEKQGIHTSREDRREGLSETVWRGRFTVLCRDPVFVVDGAHNPDAADRLMVSAERYFNGKRMIYIMGMFKDKDYRTVIERTCPRADKVFTIETPDNPRALPAQELMEAVRPWCPDVTAVPSVEAGVRAALEAAGPEDVILAFGSLSFIGLMTAAVEREKNMI